MPKFSLIKQQWFQALAVCVVAAFNLGIYVPTFFVYVLFQNNNSTVCWPRINKTFIDTLDLVNSNLVPFLLMFTFTNLLVYSVFKSRLRILRLNTPRDRVRLRKDIKFAVSSVFFNLFFVILNLPHSVYHLMFTNNQTNLHDGLYFFSLIGFCINFYILLVTNSIFRKKFLILIRMRNSSSLFSFLKSV